jgi:hypothetical protein
MALKITLKPGERMMIGRAVVTNGSATSCDLVIENKTPILRQKDILTEERPTLPAAKIYYAVQLMYIDEGNLAAYHKLYWELVKGRQGRPEHGCADRFHQRAHLQPALLPGTQTDQATDRLRTGGYRTCIQAALKDV